MTIGFNALGRMGRLANQMFQYASLKGIARNVGTDIIIPFWHDEVDGDIEGMANYLHRCGKFDKYTLTDKNGVYHEARVYMADGYKIIELSWNNCHMASAGSAYFIKVVPLFA